MNATSDGTPRGQLANMMFRTRLRRLGLACRLWGHRPVVDGADGPEPTRWVSCRRCGERPQPAGILDAGVYAIGEPYRGAWYQPSPEDRHTATVSAASRKMRFTSPGPFPPGGPHGEIGGQLIIGRSWTPGLGWRLAIFGSGLGQHVSYVLGFGWLGELRLHTKGFGYRLMRRLDPTGEGLVISEASISEGIFTWSLWRREEPCSRWRHGTWNVSLANVLFGPKRLSTTAVAGATVCRLLRLPEGEYLLELQLERVRHGRDRGRRKSWWMVSWDSALGIPTESPGPTRVFAGEVEVSQAAVTAGTWAAAAVAAVSLAVADMRTSRRWDPIGPVPVKVEAA